MPRKKPISPVSVIETSVIEEGAILPGTEALAALSARIAGARRVTRAFDALEDARLAVQAGRQRDGQKPGNAVDPGTVSTTLIATSCSRRCARPARCSGC